jgi:hypothetical protein
LDTHTRYWAGTRTRYWAGTFTRYWDSTFDWSAVSGAWGAAMQVGAVSPFLFVSEIAVTIPIGLFF